MEFTRGDLINLAYVVAGTLFIFGLKGLTHPRTAVRGNLLGATGMLLAILATLYPAISASRQPPVEALRYE